MIRRELTAGRLTTKEIREIVNGHSTATVRSWINYYKGKNDDITNRDIKDIGTPDNRIAVPYGRKIINTITGYMYRPGYIQYYSENEQAQQYLDKIFYANREPLKTSNSGRNACIAGVSYELHYLHNGDPWFTPVSGMEIIPVYDYALEPELIAAIRFYMIGTERIIEVYYADLMVQYKDRDDLAMIKEEPHFYGMVPLVVYNNNDEQIGDIEPIKSLIDAYDVLISDSMNEFDRFAWAYLILKGLKLTADDAKNIKDKRLIELLTDFGDVKFLTKDINDQFIENMKTTIREEIHKQSHVPDMTDQSFAGNQSGIAIRYKLYDLENLASTKEIYFRDGLTRRIDLIMSIMQKKTGSRAELQEFNIVFNRNIPLNITEIADYTQKLKGMVSDRTLLEQIPFVKDPQVELDRLAEEGDQYSTLLDKQAMDEPAE